VQDPRTGLIGRRSRKTLALEIFGANPFASGRIDPGDVVAVLLDADFDGREGRSSAADESLDD
jgi:hypothetical protein